MPKCDIARSYIIYTFGEEGNFQLVLKGARNHSKAVSVNQVAN